MNKVKINKVVLLLVISLIVFVSVALLPMQIIKASTITGNFIVGFWKNLTGETVEGNVIDPQVIADSITEIKNPTLSNSKLVMPTLPDGFTASLSTCSSPEIIGLDGTINFPNYFTLINVSLEVKRVKDGRSVATKPINVLVPANLNNTQSNIDFPYQSLRYGLAIHWSSGDNKMGGSAGLVKPDGSFSKGINAFCNEANIDKIVNDVAATGFNVVYITDFHGLGTTLHPSAAVDYWRGVGVFTSERDLIKEFITKLKEKGIYVVLFTHPLDGHDFSAKQQQLLGWTDPTDNFKKWNNFVNDVYADIASRYGQDIVGIGFDSAWNDQPQEQIGGIGKLDHKRLRETIKKYAPNVQLISLSLPNDVSDLSIRETWRPYWFNWSSPTNFSTPVPGSDDPPYLESDYNTDAWPSYNTSPMIVMTNHWTVTSPNTKNILRVSGTQMFRYTVMQFGASFNGPSVLWSNSPYVTGDWQLNVLEQFSVVKNLMNPIKESLDGTYPSTSYFTPQGKTIQNIVNGFIATRKPDNTAEYIHVLRAPLSKTLQIGLPADGKVFATGSQAGTILPNGEKATVNQAGGFYMVTLPSNVNWNLLDTVIKLTVVNPPKENIALFKPVYFSTSSEARTTQNNTFIHMGLTDGYYYTGNKAWSSTVAMSTSNPQWVTVDLLKNYAINKVTLASYGDGFPQDFTIETSADNKNWIKVVTKTNETMPSSKADYSFTARNARYVRITGTKGNTANGFFRLQELEVYQ